MQCTWDDFNFPCRMSTYAAAGLPFIQLRNKSHIVANTPLSFRVAPIGVNNFFIFVINFEM